MTELEMNVRAKLRDSYDSIVKDAIANAPVEFLEGAYIEMGLGHMRDGMKNIPELASICRAGGLDFSKIVEDEYEKARKRHLM